MTQREMIISHLNEYGTITPMDALKEYGVYRLAAIIHNLRADGYNIETNLIPHRNKFGNINKYAQYNLIRR